MRCSLARIIPSAEEWVVDDERTNEDERDRAWRVILARSGRLLIPPRYRLAFTILPALHRRIAEQCRAESAPSRRRYLVTPYRMRRLPPCFRVIVDHDRYRYRELPRRVPLRWRWRVRYADRMEYPSRIRNTLTNLLPHVRSE